MSEENKKSQEDKTPFEKFEELAKKVLTTPPPERKGTAWEEKKHERKPRE